MGENEELKKGDKVSVTFKVWKKFVTLYGTVDAINDDMIRVRHKAEWDKSKTTCGWFNVSNVEKEKTSD